MIEALEDRQFFSAAPGLADVDAPLKTQTAAFANKIAKNGVSSMLPLQITKTEVVNGALVATGKLGDNIFQMPLTLTAAPNQVSGISAQAVTDILNLEIGAIHLDLLGLVVDTSDICLNIGAESGPGNLLGNLLTGIANLLNGGLNLGDILGGLSAPDLNTVTGGITDLLNGVFGAILSPTNVTGVSSSANGVTDILNLSLGPVDLDLLGLIVGLDDCDGGPVTVDITAESGPGNLLGNLLGGVARLLDGPSNPNALANLLSRIGRILGGLLG
jgi:hypothetical protein